MYVAVRLKAAAKWLYRRLPFSFAVALSRGNPNLAFYIPPGPRQVTVRKYLGRFTVQVDTHSDIERRMLSRSYEPFTQAVISQFVRPGHRVMDVGSNVGAITLALAKAVGPSGHIDAFEPGPPVFAKLKQNLGLNPGLANVHAHMLGLADSEGKLLWQESETDPGNASIHWADGVRPTTTVEVTTLDAFSRRAGLDQVHFIKIDVEGMELKVIRGGAETLARFRPILYFETSLCDGEQEAAAREIEVLLRGLRYRLYKVGKRGAIEDTRYPDFAAETLALPEEIDRGPV